MLSTSPSSFPLPAGFSVCPTSTGRIKTSLPHRIARHLVLNCDPRAHPVQCPRSLKPSFVSLRPSSLPSAPWPRTAPLPNRGARRRHQKPLPSNFRPLRSLPPWCRSLPLMSCGAIIISRANGTSPFITLTTSRVHGLPGSITRPRSSMKGKPLSSTRKTKRSVTKVSSPSSWLMKPNLKASLSSPRRQNQTHPPNPRNPPAPSRSCPRGPELQGPEPPFPSRARNSTSLGGKA